MSNSIVRATALSRYYNTFEPSMLAIGDNYIRSSLQSNYDDFWNWYVVINLKDLSVVANEATTSATDVPHSVLPYQGKTGYFVFFITNAARGYDVPQGQAHDFLVRVGASGWLGRLEQIIEQLGTGTIRYTSYILAATTDDADLPGLEVMSTQGYAIATMQFKPVEGEDSTILGYAPIVIQCPEFQVQP